MLKAARSSMCRPVLLASVAGVAVIAAACGGSSGSGGSSSAGGASGVTGAATAAKGGGKSVASITWAITFPVKTLDPGLVYDGGGNNFVAFQECDSLLRFGTNMRLEPELASSWKQASPTSYVYTIRSDAKFWDGNPVTPADVAFSVNRIQDKALASPLASLASAGAIKNATVSGPHEVTITLSKPDPIAHWLAATPVGQVVEKSFAQAKGKTFGTSVSTIMCSGAYRPTTWIKGSQTVLQAQTGYWDKSHQPVVKQVTFKEVPDTTSIVAGLRSGDIQGTFDISAREAQTLKSDSNLDVTISASGNPNYISPNLLKGPLKDPLIRRALSLAIDRTGLAHALDGSVGEALKGPVPPGLTTFEQAFFAKTYNALPLPVTPDIAGAKKLVAQAHAAGTKITIAGLAGNTTDTIGAELQQAGTQVGLDVKVLKLPSSAFFAESFSGKEPRTYDGLLNFWAPDFPDPSALLVPVFGTTFSNVEGYEDPAYRALEAQWSTTKDGSLAQAQVLGKMEQMLIAKTVKIPLTVAQLVQVHAKSFGGYQETKMLPYQPFILYISGN
jgi:peptide/nickel transport system substrate-binding protein